MIVVVNSRREKKPKKNLLVMPDIGILEFIGKTIPGMAILRNVLPKFDRSGNMQYAEWSVDLRKNCKIVEVYTTHSDYWLPSNNWIDTIIAFNLMLKGIPYQLGITDLMLKKAIQDIFPDVAKAIELKIAQEHLLSEKRVELFNELLNGSGKKSFSLADLKNLTSIKGAK
jgi:hypothetical protein